MTLKERIAYHKRESEHHAGYALPSERRVSRFQEENLADASAHLLMAVLLERYEEEHEEEK